MVNQKKNIQALPTTRAEHTSWAFNNVLVPAHIVTLMHEIDATGVERLRDSYKIKGLQAPTLTAIVVKAAAMTMEAFPEANRAIIGFPGFRKLYQFKKTDISVAVEKSLPYMPGQAFATFLANSISRPLESLSQELRDLAACDETNNEQLRTFMRILRWLPTPLALFVLRMPMYIPSLWDQYRGCACWINAPSKSGVDTVMTTWPWPITFSFGFVKQRPFVVGTKVEARLTMPLVMAFDRRIMGGGPAGRVFMHFKNLLENADKHLAEGVDQPPMRVTAPQVDRNEIPKLSF